MQGFLDRTAQEDAQLLQSFDVVLAPTYAHAQAINYRQALSFPQGAFGNRALTFDEWVACLWEAQGDGRCLVRPLQRRIIAQAVIDAADLRQVTATPNLASALGSLARQGLGVEAFEQAMAQARQGAVGGIGPAQTEMLQLVDAYAHKLAAQGMCEQGQMLDVLAKNAGQVFARGKVKVYATGGAPLTCQQRLFFERCADYVELAQDWEPGLWDRPSEQAPAPLDIRFAFPSGAYALPQVLLKIVDEARSEQADARIVVAGTDPLSLYESLAAPLAQRGITCAVQARKPFYETDTGVLFATMLRAGEDGMPWDKDALSDIMHARYLDMAKSVVWQRDAALRMDRLAGHAEELGRLAGMTFFGELVACLHRVACEPVDASTFTALEAMRTRFARVGGAGDRPYANEQAAALSALAEALETCVQQGVDAQAVIPAVMQHVEVGSSWASDEQACGRVPSIAFVRLQDAAGMGTGSADVLVVCDQTTEDYPLADKLDAAGSLLVAVGVDRPEPALSKQRRLLAAILRLPRTRLVFQRCLNGPSADPLYPSALLEEFVDAYRTPEDRSSGADIDNVYRIPAALQRGMYEAGEEHFLQNVLPGASGDDLGLQAIERPRVGDVGAWGEFVIYPGGRQEPGQPLRLSASQIEAYLDCPYKWFAARRLRASGLDEEYGPREIGTFLHEVFQRFCLAFGRKVTQDNLEQARACMFGAHDLPGVFDQVLESQREGDPGNRLSLMPGTTEEHEIVYLRQRVEAWLTFETTFLPNFEPVAFEYRIKGFDYAGCQVGGSIDRIDMDAQGNVVVIDYKGSMKDEYCPYAKEGGGLAIAATPRIQTLLYARVLAQIEGSSLDEAQSSVLASARGRTVNSVQGALYVSYNKGNRVAGACPAHLVEQGAVPTLFRPRFCTVPSTGPLGFDALLQQTEQRVGEQMQQLMSCRIDPLPSWSGACDYCPVASCERRQSHAAY